LGYVHFAPLGGGIAVELLNAFGKMVNAFGAEYVLHEKGFRQKCDKKLSNGFLRLIGLRGLPASQFAHPVCCFGHGLKLDFTITMMS
jgi:hypothetical protein